MRLSQVVLLTVICVFALYLFRLRSAAGDRLMYLSLAAVGVALVLDPEFSNRVAARLGIGRGADLMFYFFILFCLFHFATTAATLRRLRRDLTALNQAYALAMPQTTAPGADADPIA